MELKKIMLVFGTRPEAVKMCPLILELRRRKGLRAFVCVTGQHRSMLRRTMECFGVRPDFDLALMREGQSLAGLTAAVLGALPPVIARERPELLLVHGDTTTALAAALCGFYLRVPVGHVEAGLRSGDLAAPFPEEFDRRAADMLSSLRFAPTPQAAENLRREGADPAGIFVTGNTVSDAMRYTLRGDFDHPALGWWEGKRKILFTAHRRESLGAPLRGMLRALRRILAENPDCRAVFPVHANPAVRAAVRAELSGCPGLRLTPPLDPAAFHNLEARCELCLTDSGGVQEECAALGKPVLLLRERTERPEAVEAGVVRLAGTREEAIVRAAEELLRDPALYARMARATPVFGDGHASERIADVIETGRCEPFA